MSNKDHPRSLLPAGSATPQIGLALIRVRIGKRNCRFKQLATVIHAALVQQHEFQGHVFRFWRISADF